MSDDLTPILDRDTLPRPGHWTLASAGARHEMLTLTQTLTGQGLEHGRRLVCAARRRTAGEACTLCPVIRSTGIRSGTCVAPERAVLNLGNSGGPLVGLE